MRPNLLLRRGVAWAGLGAMIVLALGWWQVPWVAGFNPGRAMPEFTTKAPEMWVNSKPLTKADLKGKVVLLEIYTSG